MLNLNTEKMKKLIFIMMAAVAFSCGDGNKSSEREDDGTEGTELAQPDTTGNAIQSDSTLDRDMDNLQHDTTDLK
jgi:hypothetical protein